MATFGHDVFLLQTFFRQFEHLLRIDFFFFLRLFFFLLLFIIAERESQIFFPVTGLLFFQFILVRFSQNDCFTANGSQQFFFILCIMQSTQLLNNGFFRADFLFFQKLVKNFFTYLLVCFTLFAEDGCYLGTGTGSGCKNFPLRLYALRF